MVWREVFIRQRLLSGIFSVDMGKTTQWQQRVHQVSTTLARTIHCYRKDWSEYGSTTNTGRGHWHLSNECFFAQEVFFLKRFFNPIYRFGVLFSFLFSECLLDTGGLLVISTHLAMMGNHSFSIFNTLSLKNIVSFHST